MKKIVKSLIGLGFLLAMTLYACDSKNSSQESTTEESAKIDVKDDGAVQTNYLEEGKIIATSSQGVLGKNLMNAIKSGGTKYAVEFCNVEAIPLTDSMAHVLGASVKRVTDKTRNKENQANEEELSLIKNMKKELKDGNTPKPQLVEINGKMVGYYAIVTNEMCIKCHGDKNTDIEPATYKKIKALYPSDKATDYSVNELRGMWVVEMDKK